MTWTALEVSRAEPPYVVPPNRRGPAAHARIRGQAPGSELSRQRRYENTAASRQGRLWMQDAGLATMPSYPFACECGSSRCSATCMTTPDGYVASTASNRPLIAHGR